VLEKMISHFNLDGKSENNWIYYLGQDGLVGKALDSQAKGTGFDSRLNHKRRSTW
jgi:hypothetical protein